VSELDLIMFINYMMEEFSDTIIMPFLASIYKNIIEKAKLNSFALEEENERVKERISELEDELNDRKQNAETPIEYTFEGSEKPVSINTRGRPLNIRYNI
jgi:hypothetical protein